MQRPAAHAAAAPELLPPGGQLVPQPMPVAAANGVPLRTGTRICELVRKARFPLPRPGDGLCGRQIGRIADRAAEAGGANHRAIAARQAAAGHVVPFRILDALIEQLLHAGGVELPAHAVAGPLQLDLGQLDLCLGRLADRQLLQQGRPALSIPPRPEIRPAIRSAPGRTPWWPWARCPRTRRSSCRWDECS